MTKIVAVIQCIADDVKYSSNINNYVAGNLKKNSQIDEIIMACGSKKKDSKKLINLANKWKIEIVFGSKINIPSRLLKAAKKKDADIVMRVIMRQFFLDNRQINISLNTMIKNNLDAIEYPNDFNYVFAPDIFRFEALNKASKLIEKVKDKSLKQSYYKTPLVFMKNKSNFFKVGKTKTIGFYPKSKSYRIRNKLKKILVTQNENPMDFNFKGSHYSFVSSKIKKCENYLDIACGRGNGIFNFLNKANKIVGCDIDNEQLKNLKKKFSKYKHVSFLKVKGTNFQKNNYYDLINCMHTLEHVSYEEKFLGSLYKSLKNRGNMFLEVPLLMKKPLGMPLIPSHIREYEILPLVKKLLKHKFIIKKMWGRDRYFYKSIKFENKKKLNKHTFSIILFWLSKKNE